MPSRSVLFRLVDKVLGGTLDEQLATWARNGVSKRAAAAMLTEQLDGVPVSHETAGKWMREVAP